MFLIRDSIGTVYNKVENPSAVFDKKVNTLLKIGDRDDILKYFNTIREIYVNAGFIDASDDLVFIDLPKNQEELDKVFNTTGYIGILYKKLNDNMEIIIDER